MEKRRKRNLLLAACCISVIMCSSTSMCFAEEASVPVFANMEATAVDFEITERISMVGEANSVDLTVDPMEVTNLSEIGVLNIDSIELIEEGGWEVVPIEIDFTRLSANLKKFALLADNVHDMHTNYLEAGSVSPGATDKTTFTGKTGMVTSDISDERVARMVVTVSYK